MAASADATLAVGDELPVTSTVIVAGAIASRDFMPVHHDPVRLGGPAIPGQPLRFVGRVADIVEQGDERIVEIDVNASNGLGDHATGTVSVALPR